MILIQNKLITSNIGDDTLSIIDLENNNEIESIDIKSILQIDGRIGPWDLTLNIKNQLLVLNAYDETLFVFGLETKNIIKQVKLGRNPVCIRIYGKKVYILNCDSNSLSILEEESLTQLEEIYLDEKPSDLLIDSIDSKAYIANTNGNSISIIDLLDNTIAVRNINAQPFKLLKSGDNLYILSYINNGITNYSCISEMNIYSKDIKENKIKGIFIDFIMIDENIFLLTNPEDGYLYSYNFFTNILTPKIYLGVMPHKIIFDTKERIYITDSLNNNVLIFNMINESITNKIDVGKEPQGFILL